MSFLDCNSTAEVKLRREQWRKAQVRHRESETLLQWHERTVKQKERSARNRHGKSKEETQKIRETYRTHKANKLKNESKNQRFWRLIRRREYRRCKDHNSAIAVQYHHSIGMYGAKMPDNAYVHGNTSDNVDSVGALPNFSIKEESRKFYEMLELAKNGLSIPQSSFEFLRERDIEIPDEFFEMYIEDL